MKHNKLKSKRVELGLRQEDVAREINMATASYCRKERGDREFKHSEIMKICKILDLTKEELSNIFF